MIDSVREQTDGSFGVFSDDAGINDIKLKYNVSFALEITRLFVAAHVEILDNNTSLLSESGRKQSSDQTKPFLNNPFTNLD